MEEIYIYTTMHREVSEEEAERCRKLIDRLKEKTIEKQNRKRKNRKNKDK